MKLITFEHNGTVKAGFLDGDSVSICADGPGADTAVLERIKAGQNGPWDAKEVVSLSDVRLMAPIPTPRRDILCVGKNYHAHAAEFFNSGFDSSAKEEVPSSPVIFTKMMTSVVGPGEDVLGSLDPTGSVDYEGELGVIISKDARRVSKADAYDYVYGYVIINDVTSRELQKTHNQWVIGKGLDTFCPIGPWIATADEIDDVGAMELVTRINGEVRQKAVVKDLVFDIPTLIECITATGTLLAGDIIATGTPAGVGIGFNPTKYLNEGDRMQVSISGLGELENTIR
ncbi:fumarylacetoacetate hydrolase family protein [Paracoccus sp. Z330]|uniref:Fumarylacetoacetate hydrolase family protein n=1 Tax=Paracoccus onchidii TaxID=3017813 RepID=A0ABT4ZJW0_9RHOB|nr:fumarylacetoacetate hydrolase family protein [Paracoccus onchidii]MDB6179645.1 fumarylacetoacetate hydrolase family protein [Paracoccus onchidii]